MRFLKTQTGEITRVRLCLAVDVYLACSKIYSDYDVVTNRDVVSPFASVYYESIARSDVLRRSRLSLAFYSVKTLQAQKNVT